ncbi:hypothetical protein D9M68_764010 [compost metagenome]
MPEAVHGASSRMASNRAPSHQSAGRPASATTTLAFKPRRASVSSMRRLRTASTSSAVTSTAPGPARSIRCAVLPPGAAQASSTRSGAAPGVAGSRPSSSKGAASCAAASCTEQAPSAKPGSCCTGRARASCRPSAPTRVAARPTASSSSRYAAGVDCSALTRKVIGAWALSADSTRCQSRGWSRLRRSIHQRGWFHCATGSVSVAATSSSRSRRKRRRQALMKLACARVAGLRLAASTAWSTSVKGS